MARCKECGVEVHLERVEDYILSQRKPIEVAKIWVDQNGDGHSRHPKLHTHEV